MAAAVLTVLLVCFFWEAVLLGRALLPVDLIYFLDPVWRNLAPSGRDAAGNPLLSDQVHFFYPWRAFTFHWIGQSELPLWNPSILGGLPFVGNDQSAVFSPINLIALLWPLPNSFAFAALARLLLAGLSTYGYLRVTGRTRAAAYLGAIAFSLCGFLVVWLGYPLAEVAAWLPAILLLIEMVWRSGRLRWAGLLALAVGAQFLGGHVETSFHLAVIAAAYVLFLAGRSRRCDAPSIVIRRVWFVLLGAFLGLGIGAIQVLPFLEALSQSTLAAERSAEFAGASVVWYPDFWRHLVTLPTLIFPTVLGSPVEPVYFPLLINFNEGAGYVGTITLILALVGAGRFRRDSRIGFWLVAGLVSLAVAYRLPVFEAVNHLPLFSITANGRLRLVFSFAAIVLAAAGFDWLLQRLERPSPESRRDLGRLISLAGGVGLLAGVGMLALSVALRIGQDQILDFGWRYVESNVAGQPGFTDPLDFYLTKVQTYYETAVNRARPLNPQSYLPALSGICLAGLVWSGRRARWGRRLAAIAVPAVVAGELFVFGAGSNPTIEPARIFPPTPAVQFLRANAGTDRIAGLGLALTPNSAQVWGLQDLRGYEVVRPARSWELLGGMAGRLPFGGYLLLRDATSPLLDLMGVRYVIAGSDAARPDPAKFRPVFSADGITIYENRRAAPRAAVVGRAAVLDDPAEIRRRVHAGAFDPAAEVMLEAEQRPPVEGLHGGSGRAEIVDDRPNTVAIQTRADSDGYLVLSDTDDGGWQALVDGRPAPIFRANYAFRAVRVPAGDHRVVFEYRPAGFSVGAWATAAGLVTAGALIVWPARRPKRPDRA